MQETSALDLDLINVRNVARHDVCTLGIENVVDSAASAGALSAQ